MKLRVANNTIFAFVEKELNHNQVTITVRGDSMSPFLRDSKDKVILKKISADKIGEGDIALFRYQKRFLLHRLVDISGTTFCFRGDRLSHNKTENVEPQDVVAVVVAVIRNGKRINCNSMMWRTLSGIWSASLPMRIAMSKIKNICKNSD